MKTDKNDNWLDNALGKTIGSERKEANFESFKARHSQAVEKLISRSSQDTAVSPPNIWRIIMKSRITKLAAAAVIVLAAVVGTAYFTASIDGSNIALADVIERISEAHNVKYKETFYPGQKNEFTTEQMINEWGVIRSVFSNGDINLFDFIAGKQLSIMPRSKRATLTHRVGRKRHKGLFNYYLSWISRMHEKEGEFIGTELINGIRADVFVVKAPFEETTIWVNPETNLPIEIKMVDFPNPDKNIIVPKMRLSERDFGGERNVIRSITIVSGRGSPEGIHNEMTIVMSDFVWNADVDASLFSLVPPEGYTLEEKQFDVTEPGETQLIEALAFWTEMCDGQFPSKINDLGDQDKVKALLVAKYDRDGDPKEELEDACKKMNRILQAVYFVQEQKVGGSWGYAGDGVKLGESDVAICWWKKKDSDTYRVIYGDISIADSNDVPQLEN